MTASTTRSAKMAALGVIALAGSLALFNQAGGQEGDPDQRVVARIAGAEIKALLEEDGVTDIILDEDDDLIYSVDGTTTVLLTSAGKNALMFQFSWTGTDSNLRKVNDWNRTKRFSRAYIDDDGDPVLEMDLDLDGGVTIARVRDFLRMAFPLAGLFAREAH